MVEIDRVAVEEQKLDLLRQCVNRQRPFGKIESQGEIARLFGLESTLRPLTEWVSPSRLIAVRFLGFAGARVLVFMIPQP